MAGGEVHLRKLKVAQNPGQDVVEVMGDPAGQRPEGFRPLGPAQVLPEYLLLLFVQQRLSQVVHGLRPGGDQPITSLARRSLAYKASPGDDRQ